MITLGSLEQSSPRVPHVRARRLSLLPGTWPATTQVSVVGMRDSSGGGDTGRQPPFSREGSRLGSPRVEFLTSNKVELLVMQSYAAICTYTSYRPAELDDDDGGGDDCDKTANSYATSEVIST